MVPARCGGCGLVFLWVRIGAVGQVGTGNYLVKMDISYLQLINVHLQWISAINNGYMTSYNGYIDFTMDKRNFPKYFRTQASKTLNPHKKTTLPPNSQGQSGQSTQILTSYPSKQYVLGMHLHRSALMALHT